MKSAARRDRQRRLGPGRARHGRRQRRAVCRHQGRRDGLHPQPGPLARSPGARQLRCARLDQDSLGRRRFGKLAAARPSASRCWRAGARPRTSPRPCDFWSRRRPPSSRPKRSPSTAASGIPSLKRKSPHERTHSFRHRAVGRAFAARTAGRIGAACRLRLLARRARHHGRRADDHRLDRAAAKRSAAGLAHHAAGLLPGRIERRGASRENPRRARPARPPAPRRVLWPIAGRGLRRLRHRDPGRDQSRPAPRAGRHPGRSRAAQSIRRRPDRRRLRPWRALDERRSKPSLRSWPKATGCRSTA